jgi:hypothetical protein
MSRWWRCAFANIRGGKNNTKGPSDIFGLYILEDGSYGTRNLGNNVNSYSRRNVFRFMVVIMRIFCILFQASGGVRYFINLS